MHIVKALTELKDKVGVVWGSQRQGGCGLAGSRTWWVWFGRLKDKVGVV